MLDTMYNAKGIGLSASQIGLNINLFIMDDLCNKKVSYIQNKVFINPKILKIYGSDEIYLEGCLSIPHVLDNITRKSSVILQYTDINNNTHIKKFHKLHARIIQHEYDHTRGVLFIDYLSMMKKKILENKLKNIDRGNVKVSYPIKK
jgi:peptide deformylase